VVHESILDANVCLGNAVVQGALMCSNDVICVCAKAYTPSTEILPCSRDS